MLTTIIVITVSFFVLIYAVDLINSKKKWF